MNIIRPVFKFPLIEVAAKYQSQFRPALSFLPACTKCYYTTEPNNKVHSSEDDSNSDEPIKYSETVASEWKAADSRRGHKKFTRPASEPSIILLSLTVFMLYFCVLREENDLDANIGKSLYNRIDGLEESQLRNVLRYNIEKGLETSEIITRLEELENERKR